MATRGGRREPGVRRPDPAEGPWAELACALHDELYIPAGRPSVQRIHRRSGVSAGHIHKMLTGSGRSRFDDMGLALVGCFGGDPALWEERWRDAERRQRELERVGTLPLLPWIDEPDPDQPPSARAVGDWDTWSPLGRLRARLGRVRFLPGAFWSALTTWLALLRLRPARRRHEIMLLRVRRHAHERIADAIAGPYLTPSFLRLVKAPAPSRRRVKHLKLIPRSFAGEGIRDLFEDTAHDLVLVGDAGIGKSIQLAALARTLADEALQTLEEAPAAPGDDPGAGTLIPVLLSLAPYAGQPLEDWIVQQIEQVYDVAPQLSRQWLVDGRLLPLLDGLDQVPERHRRECAAQIRRYRRTCAGVVIACRDRDLVLSLEIGGELAMLRAPTRRQVHDYLAASPSEGGTPGGEAYRDVRDALEADPELWTLLRSPLMLNVIHTTYADRAATELRLPGLTIEQRRARIFDAYILRMLRQPGPYTAQVALDWLAALARRLHERGEEVLYLDRIDGSWVAPRLRPHLHVVPRWVFQIVVLLLMVPWLWVLVALDLIQPDKSTASRMTILGVIVLLTYLTDRHKAISLGRRAAPAMPLVLPASAGFTPDGTTLPGLLGLCWFWAGMDARKAFQVYGYTPIEQLRWSWVPSWLGTFSVPRLDHAQLRTGLITTVLLSVTMVTGVETFLTGVPLPFHLFAVGFAFLSVYLFVGDRMHPGLKDTRRRPNEGIRRSARYALLQGAVTLLLTVGFAFLSIRATTDAGLRPTLLAGLFVGTLVGASNAYRVGGAACVYYWTLRVVLARQREIPYRYGRFLSDAERRILVQRSGSGFRFPHRLIQDHIRLHAPTLRERL
ncbi:hypothetical protein ABZ864_25415 [Streptomyces sp. NPDC047082]|uniref:NACHT domain-containing protein n=1 Tax=Streptomyces sp. NPDC047082 TaxID=3155259 RepID=UPI0034106ADC